MNSKSQIDQLILDLRSSGYIAIDKLSTGINLDEPGTHGRTLLMTAAYEGMYDVVKELIESGAKVDAVKRRSSLTALHEASSEGHSQIVQLLLDRGADVEAVTVDGVTPLHCAAAWGHIEVAKILPSHGADINKVENTGASAADIAGEKGEDEFVEFIDLAASR